MIQVENVLEKIVSLLKASMQTKLDAIKLEEGDGLTLKAPRDNEYYIHEIDNIPTLSAIIVRPNATTVIVPGGTYNEDDHDITIIVIVRGKEGDISKCAQRAYRFTRAVREIVLDNPTLDDTIVGFYAKGIDYSPMMADGRALLMTVNIGVIAKTHGTN